MMKLLNKILLAPGIALIFLVAVGLTGYFALSSQRQALNDLVRIRQEHARVANDFVEGVLSVHSIIYRIFTWSANTATDQAKLNKTAKAQFDRVDKMGLTFGKWLSQPEIDGQERELGKKMQVALLKYKKSIVQAIDLATVDVNTGLSAMQTADDDFKALDKLGTQLVVVEKNLGEKDYAASGIAYTHALEIMATVFALALAMVIAISLLIARAIVRPITDATGVAARVADGDLSATIPAGGNDEVGQLLLALKRMQDELRQMIGSIDDGSRQVGSAAENMAAAAGQISRSAEAQSEAISNTAAAVEQMTVSIGQVSENAGAARGVAQKTSEIADRGKHQADTTATEIRKIASSVDNSAQVMRELQASSQQISQIANVIRGIADQTNLLALNAAIEAARAGEQGRGFAVVADEVRKLAEQTGSATNEIQKMIDTIQSQTASAAVQMGQVNEQVVSGVELIEGLQGPLEELREGASRAVANLIELSNAATEQATASTEIARNIERIAQMGEENSAAASKGTETAKGLDNLSRDLLSVVGRFRR